MKITARINNPLAAVMVLCCAICIPPAEAPAQDANDPTSTVANIIPAGSSEAIWLVRTHPNGSFDVVAKGIGEQWRWITAPVSGVPATASAVGDRLYVLFAR